MTIEKILLIEDSRTETLIISKILEEAGFSVRTAGNAEQAMEKLRIDRPDLIVMDVVMPGQSGYQLTRNLAKDPDFSSVPIIICSSKSLETDRVWGLRQGARDYITKPVDAKLLLDAIRRISAA